MNIRILLLTLRMITLGSSYTTTINCSNLIELGSKSTTEHVRIEDSLFIARFVSPAWIRCTAFFINPELAMTCAHCFQPKLLNMKVVINTDSKLANGTVDLEQPNEILTVSQVLLNTHYMSLKFSGSSNANYTNYTKTFHKENDIALLRINKIINIGDKLPRIENISWPDKQKDRECILLGYTNGALSKTKVIPSYGRNSCSSCTTSKNYLCSERLAGSSMSSGSPLLCDNKIVAMLQGPFTEELCASSSGQKEASIRNNKNAKLSYLYVHLFENSEYIEQAIHAIYPTCSKVRNPDMPPAIPPLPSDSHSLYNKFSKIILVDFVLKIIFCL